ncbi:MFS-type transporter SLC18B1 [Strongyloides ratti]|uniref:MFS-type transporter SLC18B1 n=1 Tax=Strongyloides ratti TaxID=34506 RepID=A0A090LH23_STRRB|nr:MFS-type transporter SLC18B1 [Strongyloides ratti]CEF69096.1 MFS-type transporter SLC18B1 [Strongyloides ratti]
MSIYKTPYESLDNGKESLTALKHIDSDSETSSIYYELKNEYSYQYSSPNDASLLSTSSTFLSNTSKLTNIKVPVGRRYTFTDIFRSSTPTTPNIENTKNSVVSLPDTNKRKHSTSSIVSASTYGSLRRGKIFNDYDSYKDVSGSIKKIEQVKEDKIDDDSVSNKSQKSIKLKDLSKKEWIIIVMLAMSNLCSTIAFSCIAPFYPLEAQQKGMDKFETGIVFGIFEFMMFITTPIMGKYMVLIGSKRMFSGGLLTTAFTSLAFGFINYIPAGSFFFWISVLLRVVEAIGDAAFVTSSFAIAAKCFPNHIATIVGLMETFAGIGYTAGPMIGGILYEYGGFQLPFIVLGGSLLFTAICSLFAIENFEDEICDSSRGMIGMLKMPLIWIMSVAVVLCAVSISFLDPTLAGHLESFDLSPTMVGIMFLFCAGGYTISAPLLGILVDKYSCANTLLVVGAIATMSSMFAIGPAPFIPFDKDLYVISIALTVLGFAAGALFIPTFQTSLDAVKEKGYEDNFQTYGCVSGIFQSAFALGGFLGPTIGGFSAEWFGFNWTVALIGFANGIFLIILFIYILIIPRIKKNVNNLERKEDISTTPLNTSLQNSSINSIKA